MKGQYFTRISLIAALCLATFSVFAQINPTTQIKGVSPPAANNLLMTRGSDGKLEYKTLNYLIGLLPDEVVQAPGAPVGAPGVNQGLLYVDTATGVLYAWNGTAWISYALDTYANALTQSGTTVRWGGDLTQNTAVNGKSAYSLTLDSLSTLTLRARTSDGSGSGVLGLSKFESIGAFATYSRVSNPAESSQWSLKPDAAYLRTQNSGTRGELLTTNFSAQIAYMTGESSLIGAFYVDSTGHYLLQLQDKTAAETEMLYINPTTFEVSKGPPPAGGSTVSTYTPATSGSGSLSVVVTATGAGITAVRGSGTLTLTIPAGVTLLSARVTGDDAENDGSGNLTVTFTGAGLQGNEGIASLHIPATQKIDLSAQVFGAPAPGNPYSVDDDDTVQMQVVGVGSSGSPGITIRAVGLTTNYDDYQLVFNF
jgi:hypothetical protein